MIRTAVVLLTTLVTGTALAPVPAGATQLAGLTAGRYQNQGFEATNRVRQHHERAGFRSQDCVQRFAQRQAGRMARQDRMFHQDLRPVLQRCGLTSAGENVAYGYPTGRSVVRAWMHSDGHRANILNPGFRLLGMAAARDDDGTVYSAQVFGRH